MWNPQTYDAELGDISAWMPLPGTDVAFSNAALQWIPGYAELMVRWAGLLEPGAWIAIQVPGNFGAPSHVAIRWLADQGNWSKILGDFMFRKTDVVETPMRYAELLTSVGCGVDAWETTYLHEHLLPVPPDLRRRSGGQSLAFRLGAVAVDPFIGTLISLTFQDGRWC